MKAYEAALKIREYGAKTNQNTWAFADQFYTMSTQSRDGVTGTAIIFKKHSFTNLLGAEAPEDIFSTLDDKLIPAFQIGLSGGKPQWNVPAQ